MTPRLQVETNWDNNLIGELAGLGIDGLYGRAPADMAKKHVEEHIRLVAANGLRFAYLVDDVCLDNKEQTRTGFDSIDNHMRWLSSQPIDEIIVGSFFMISMIKERYPAFSVTVSDMAAPDSLQRAVYFADFGADSVIMRDANRDFKLLDAIKETGRLRLKSLANSACVYECALAVTHANQYSHYGRFISDEERLPGDAVNICRDRILANPVELVKARWIRPEDLEFYGRQGFEDFLVAAPSSSTGSIAAAARAYGEGLFNGNLLEIMSLTGGASAAGLKDKFTLRSADFDGFLEGFLTRECHKTACEDCGYCKEAADQGVIG